MQTLYIKAAREYWNNAALQRDYEIGQYLIVRVAELVYVTHNELGAGKILQEGTYGYEIEFYNRGNPVWVYYNTVEFINA